MSIQGPVQTVMSSSAPQPAPSATPPSDFNIRPPADAAPVQATPVPAGAAPSTTTGTGTPISAAGLPGEAGLSSTETVIGVAILLVLGVAIFFVRAAVRSHLIAGRASPSAAGSAGWALFAFLLSLSVLIVFGLIGSLWPVLAFTLPLALLILVTLVLFVVLYRAAAQGRPARRRG